MARKQPSIRVSGLREFRERVEESARAKPDAMKSMFDHVGKIIVDNAIPMIEGDFVSAADRRTGALVDSLRTQSSDRAGRVVMGYPKRVAYAGWWEFGGPKAPGSRPPNREWIKQGRSIIPALHKNEELVLTAMDAAIAVLAAVIDG
ncbi:hypothetical protein GCM10009760_25960 [Kitasatospora kazusensis]|uniref:HK97 gp10 family phage protein n=1 Tax=Kitasatospora kazusensis TaxID=407974 RepID=A0ABP5L6V9_9ACTN